MNSKEFFSSVADGEITVNQPIGLISVKNEYPETFVAAYFRRGTFPHGKYNLCLDFNQPLEYTPSTDRIDANFHGWYVRDETDTIFSNKENFEKRMQSLMTVVIKKNNFPLFVRDLSKLNGWK